MSSAQANAALRLLVTDGPWVAMILLAAALGQWLVLYDGAIPIVSSDGLLYLSDAHALPALHGLVDARIPPGYPALLAAIFVIAGRDNLDAVLIFQAALFLAAMLELYVLLRMLVVHRALAAIVVSLLAAAPWLVQWERYVLTEAFSLWAVITLLLTFTRLLRRQTWGSALVCGLIGALLPLTRPALSLVPATLVLVLLLRAVFSRRAGDPFLGPALAALVLGAASYLPVCVYIAGNAAVNGCYCYTSTGNKNLFGKIFEYGMQDFPADARYSTIAAQVRAADSVNRFFDSNPQYEAQNYAPLGAYASSQFLRYPGFTARVSVREIRYVLTLAIDHAVLVEHPYACRADPSLPYPLVTSDTLQPSDVPLCTTTTVSVGALGEDVNRIAYAMVFLAYVAIPVSLVLAVALLFAKPKRERAAMLLATAAVVSAAIVSSAIGGYAAFDRLKVPVDGAALAAAALMLSELWFVVSELRSSRRSLAGGRGESRLEDRRNGAE